MHRAVPPRIPSRPVPHPDLTRGTRDAFEKAERLGEPGTSERYETARPMQKQACDPVAQARSKRDLRRSLYAPRATSGSGSAAVSQKHEAPRNPSAQGCWLHDDVWTSASKLGPLPEGGNKCHHPDFLGFSKTTWFLRGSWG